MNPGFGRTAVDSTWSKIGTREPYARLFRTDLTGAVRLVNVVPPGAEYLSHLKQLDIWVPRSSASAEPARAGNLQLDDSSLR